MKVTESESSYQNIDKMTTLELLQNINQEDKKVAQAIEKIIPQIEPLVAVISDKMWSGGRLFYIGAGTSGRLGIVDASECPPTFGVPADLVIGIIAGGDTAIRKAVEFAEDDEQQAWKDLQSFEISTKDVVIGIAASGSTPYVFGGLKSCQENGIITGCIVCNAASKMKTVSDFPIEIVVGPEFITGSTRMKSGTAQKLVLNMISTAVMVKMGRVEGNRMVNMQLSNDKLIDRGVNMVMEATHLDKEKAKEILLKNGSVKNALEEFKRNSSPLL